VLYTLLVAYLIRSTCVELPNGLLIGHEAYIDPSNYLWSPTVVLKYPDGRPVLPDWVEDFNFSQTTVYGVTLNGLLGRDHPAYRRNVAFAYRPDVGLVYKHDHPLAYERLKEEAGPLIWLRGNEGQPVHMNLLATYFELKADETKRRDFCPLRFLPDRRRSAGAR
jgi:hypothetical protein